MKNHEPKDDYLKVIDQFNSLSVEQKLQIFSKLPSKAREDLVSVISRPGEIIRQLSEEEMFFTIKDLGEENAEKLIALTTGKQLMYLLDIDLWTMKDLNVFSISKWFQLLAGVGEEKIIQFVQISEPELICSILNKAIIVKLKDPDVDLTEQLDYLPPFTLDNYFFIDFWIPSAEEYIKEFLDCIFRYDSNYYTKIVQALSTGWLVEYEDLAYKWRSARLADHGFPDIEEAMDIYSLFNPALIRTGEAEDFCPDKAGDWDLNKLLRYPIVELTGSNLFEKTLQLIEEPQLKDRITAELAHVANKVMVADGKDAGSIEALRNSLQKTSGYINLAIEEITSRQNGSAMNLLTFNHMENLFRYGHTLVMRLQYEARSFLSNCDGGIENQGFPLAPLLTGLLQKRPFFDQGTTDGGGKRDFQFISDLEMISSLIRSAGEGTSWEYL